MSVAPESYQHSYSGFARSLHWIVALLVLTIIPVQTEVRTAAMAAAAIERGRLQQKCHGTLSESARTKATRIG